jgi:predicted hotdog family 3-hydroxylacyl-ACP dehydratase
LPAQTDTFLLDDAVADDDDLISNTLVVDVSPGTYMFAESVPPAWTLIELSFCQI